MAKSKSKARFLGVGLDNEDGHTRITRGPDYTLYGGSEQTHSHMQEVSAKVSETLTKRGKSLQEVSPQELRETIREIEDKVG
jgi:hypothetical protein